MKEYFDPVAIGQRLKEVRGRKSQAEFAEQLGVTHKSISNYEIGKRVPDVEFICKLMKDFGVDSTWLITGQYAVTSKSNLSTLKELRAVIDEKLDEVITNLEKGKG